MRKHVPWVFLRGLMRDRRHWGDFPDDFRAAVGDVPIETLDFPGNGSRHDEQSLGSVEEMAAFCRNELRRRGVEPPYRVLAMSLGAMVATAWASDHPDEVEACVLINTSLRPFCPPHWRLRPRVWSRLLQLALRSPSPRTIERQVLALTSRLRRDRERLLDDWTRWRLEQPVSTGNARRQLLAAAQFLAPVAEPETRLLVLCSAADGLVDPRCSKRLAARWGCDLAIHPQAGHDLPLDDGPWVADVVRRWLHEGL